MLANIGVASKTHSFAVASDYDDRRSISQRGYVIARLQEAISDHYRQHRKTAAA